MTLFYSDQWEGAILPPVAGNNPPAVFRGLGGGQRNLGKNADEISPLEQLRTNGT